MKAIRLLGMANIVSAVVSGHRIRNSRGAIDEGSRHHQEPQRARHHPEHKPGPEHGGHAD